MSLPRQSWPCHGAGLRALLQGSRAATGLTGSPIFPAPCAHAPASPTPLSLPRLTLRGYSGPAGQPSGLALQGTNFSTRDADNDNCLCKCAQMLSGGERAAGSGAGTMQGEGGHAGYCKPGVVVGEG